MLVFLALSILYPDNRPSGFVMATKTCRAAKLHQRLLNSMRSLSVLKETSESEYFGRYVHPKLEAMSKDKDYILKHPSQ